MNFGFISSGVSGRTFVNREAAYAEKMHNKGMGDLTKQMLIVTEIKY